MMRNRGCATPTVMVIEGIVDAPTRLTEWLRVKGYQVMEETNIENAMENAVDYTQRERPDLILLSLSQLPSNDLSTLDFLRIKAEIRNIPIVVISNSGSDSPYGDVVIAGDSEYLVRLENARQLTNLIDNLLHRINDDWDIDERKSKAKTQ